MAETIVPFIEIKSVTEVEKSKKTLLITFLNEDGLEESVTIPKARLIQMRILAEFQSIKELFSPISITNVTFDLTRKPHKRLSVHKSRIEKINRIIDLAILGKENAYQYYLQHINDNLYAQPLYPEYRIFDNTITGEVSVEVNAWRKVL